MPSLPEMTGRVRWIRVVRWRNDASVKFWNDWDDAIVWWCRESVSPMRFDEMMIVADWRKIVMLTTKKAIGIHPGQRFVLEVIFGREVSVVGHVLVTSVFLVVWSFVTVEMLIDWIEFIVPATELWFDFLGRNILLFVAQVLWVIWEYLAADCFLRRTPLLVRWKWAGDYIQLTGYKKEKNDFSPKTKVKNGVYGWLRYRRYLHRRHGQSLGEAHFRRCFSDSLPLTKETFLREEFTNTHKGLKQFPFIGHLIFARFL